MPYILGSQRARVEPRAGGPATNAGELTYQLTRLLVNYLQGTGLKFVHIAECLGALSATQLEFYDRVVRPYEDTKIKENGDCYDRDTL